MTRLLKRVTGANIVCGLTLQQFKDYITCKYEKYKSKEPRKLRATNRLGLQIDAVIVYNDKVTNNRRPNRHTHRLSCVFTLTEVR